ncbi:MAG: TetR/AcrR family transcriptional regulator [Bacteroidota bacterium]
MDFTPRQIEIIEAATKLIGEKGLQNVTTKHLAEEIGFSEPALYRHFKGKTEILISVLEYFRIKTRSSLEPILSKQESGLEKVHHLLNYQFKMFTTNPAVIMVIFAETSFQYDKRLSDTVSKLLSQKKQLVINILNEGIADGSIRNDISAEQLASIILGSMRFNVLQWRLSNFDFELTGKGKELWKTINLLLKKKD